MDRRKSLQTLILGGAAVSTGVAFNSCKSETIDEAIATSNNNYFGRTPEELERIEKLNAEQLFNEHEMETIVDHKSNTEFGTEFKSATIEQKKQICDEICWHDIETSLDKQPLEIQFFYMMRGLTVTGYYTSKVGIADLGYKGNMPNVWDGVPQDVLDQHGVAYDPEWIAKCIDQSTRGTIATWDDNGNLLT